MIAQWLAYAILLAFWLCLISLLGERALRLLGRSARFIWVSALIMSALLPIGVAIVSASTGTVGHAGDLFGMGAASRTPWLLAFDRVLLLAWFAASVILALVVLQARRSLRHASRNWRPAQLHGASVMLSHDFGPGVIVLGRPRIVLPGWALDLDAAVRELLVRHECEHLRARDHWLILLGLGLLVLFPFNPMLWWQVARLKLAIEMDCDARVLSGRQNVRAYAALLLDVGERSRTGRFAFAAFAAPPHAIERRIRMMLNPKSKRWPVAVVLSAAGAVAIGVLACQTPEPESPEAAIRAAIGIADEPPLTSKSRDVLELQ
ncbi:MAG: M56 family metallopeptidase, partial [Vitreimonas sp.]